MRLRRSRQTTSLRAAPLDPPPMRFIIDPDTSSVAFPMDFLGDYYRRLPRPPRGASPPPELPPTEIVGAVRDSVDAAAASGRMNDLILDETQDPLFVHHDLVTRFEYELVPVPRLTLGMGPNGGDTFRFVNAVIIDWTTSPDYSPEHPNNELCEFAWDGRQHFMLEFLSFRMIVRAERLELELQTDE